MPQTGYEQINIISGIIHKIGQEKQGKEEKGFWTLLYRVVSEDCSIRCHFCSDLKDGKEQATQISQESVLGVGNSSMCEGPEPGRARSVPGHYNWS